MPAEVTVWFVRLFFSRRWILFAVTVVLMSYGALWLGEWQFHRLDERKARNIVTTHNLKADPVPVDRILGVGQPVDARHEWLRVTATGRYVEAATVLVRYQTRDGQSGVDVVTPLRTEAGPGLLVDRGWMQTANSGAARADVPAAPRGQVTVVGWVRADAVGDATTVTDGSTRAISSEAIGAGLPFPVYSGFVDAATETPPPAEPLVRAELPDLSNGPHFFYGLQWWFFGALAVFGFFYLAWDERRKKLRAAAEPEDATVEAPPQVIT